MTQQRGRPPELLAASGETNEGRPCVQQSHQSHRQVMFSTGGNNGRTQYGNHNYQQNINIMLPESLNGIGNQNETEHDTDIEERRFMPLLERVLQMITMPSTADNRDSTQSKYETDMLTKGVNHTFSEDVTADGGVNSPGTKKSQSVGTTSLQSSSTTRLQAENSHVSLHPEDNVGTTYLQSSSTLKLQAENSSVSFHPEDKLLSGGPGLEADSSGEPVSLLGEYIPSLKRTKSTGYAETTERASPSGSCANEGILTQLYLLTVIVLDISNSIGPEHVNSVKSAGCDFVNAISQIDKENGIREYVCIIAMGDGANIIVGPTSDYQLVKKTIRALEPGGLSPLPAALELSISVIEKRDVKSPRPRILVFTDGLVTKEARGPGPDTKTKDHTTLWDVNKFIKYVTINDLCSITWIPFGDDDRSYLKSLGKLAKGGVVEQTHVAALCRYFLLHVTVRQICNDIMDRDIPTTERQMLIEGYAGTYEVLLDEKRVVMSAVRKYLEGSVGMDDAISLQDLMSLSFPQNLLCKTDETDANEPSTAIPITVSPLAGPVDFKVPTDKMNTIWQWKDSQGRWHLYDEIHMKKLEKDYSRKPTGSCLLTTNNKSVRIVFSAMQERHIEGGTTNKVRRLVLSDAALTTLESEMSAIDY